MRLGDFDELKEEIKRKVRVNQVGVFSAKRIFDIIDNAPTIECEILTKEAYSDLCLRASKLRPQGAWIMNKTSARGRNYTCTACNKVSRNKFCFCPNCGAKMKGKEE